MKKCYFWLKALTLEVLIFVGSWFLPFFKKVNLKWVNPDKQKPILLIHGYLHNGFVWFYHGRKLKNKGFGPIYTISIKNPFSSIEQISLEIKQKVKSIQEETGISDLILIGHSMGGLVASYFALNIAEKNTISDVITIASPLEGTALAVLGFGMSAKEMRRNSNFIKDLDKKLLLEENINFYHIASLTDQLIRPYTSALLGNKEDRQYILNGLGHAAMLYSKKVNDKISSWLS
ncbi:MAG: 2-succinyl-6-hydroxy-2,4-cyclohexadiene-1-carboxylate synthase [Candidatus Anoxychlamydiales bacterium]|nr:2-succinyl-6-hydroxy-2,4-cyclohexadiene-1-carboxylate synthase [Candidatus Anoxychlamydiales bacterium]